MLPHSLPLSIKVVPPNDTNTATSTTSISTAVLPLPLWIIRLLMCIVAVAATFATTSTVAAEVSVSSHELTVLHTLYNSTNGDSWQWLPESFRSGMRWNFTQDSSGEFLDDPCTTRWQGITCSGSTSFCSTRQCQILGIDLGDYSMAGSIPSELGDLVRLQFLGLFTNALTGTIPSEIGSLVDLTRLYLFSNSLSGSIPSEIGNLSKLILFDLSNNALNGSIPSEVGNFVLVEWFDLDNNSLEGKIPNELGNLVSMTEFDVDHNSLTGMIPSEVGSLTRLLWFLVNDNSLTGFIPREIGSLISLEWIDIRRNALSGPIPSEVGNLENLIWLEFDSNALSESLPRELGKLAKCDWFDTTNNALTGPIPDEFGNLKMLEWLEVDDNVLSGTIPSHFGNLANLQWLNLSNNILSGTIPKEVGNIVNLQSVFLQSNNLRGDINEIFNIKTQPYLDVLDLSDNMLSGDYTKELFLFPSLRVLSLSVNCFDMELPEIMCEASNLEVLLLNGLGAAEGCTNAVRFPISGVLLFNAIGGTLPPCVWQMESLTVLHLIGNALSGTLVPRLPSTSRFSDLFLSHNRFSGPIPDGIQQVSLADLSFNRFSSSYGSDAITWSQGDVNLEINRLSGQLPVSRLENISNVKILRGNMFSCESIPENDDFFSDYICGSADLNESLIVFASTVFIIGCMVLVVFFLGSLSRTPCRESSLVHSNAVSQARIILQYLTLVPPTNDVEDERLRPLALLSAKFKSVMKLFLNLFVVVVCGCLPVYIARGLNSDISTHHNTYAWFWTYAHLRGVVPAVLVLLSWSATLGACFYRFIVSPFAYDDHNTTLQGKHRDSKTNILNDNTVETRNGQQDKEVSSHSRSTSVSIWIAGTLIFNAAVAVTVNSLYIYGTQQPVSVTVQFMFQLGLAVFRMAYSYCALPLLARPIANPVDNVRFRGRLLLVNNLLIPCIATAFTSPSCAQGLIAQVDKVMTSYSMRSCAFAVFWGNSWICQDYETVLAESAAIVPPFVYNHQCSSVLLTSFIPVLIIGFSIQLMLVLIVPIMCYFCGKWFNLSAFFSRKPIIGIVWPHLWLQSNDSAASKSNKQNLDNDPMILLTSRSILCFDVLNNVMIFLTFGLCSPVLAAAVACVAVFKMNLLVALVGRFISALYKGDSGITCHGSGKGEIHFALLALCKLPFPLTEVVQQSFWMLAWASAMFFTILCLDIACDEVGWAKSIWVPMWTLSYPVVLWSISRYFVKKNRHGDIDQGGGKEEMNRQRHDIDSRRSDVELSSSFTLPISPLVLTSPSVPAMQKVTPNDDDLCHLSSPHDMNVYELNPLHHI